MTKSPIAEARELLKSGRITELMDMVALLRIIEYAELLERKLNIPKCKKCNDTGKLHGCQRPGKHGLEYYSADCDCKNAGD